MSNSIILLVLAALALQFPIAILVYIDAKRLDLENPERYWLGIVVPAGGLVVVLYYLSERKTLPRKEVERS